jgi:integrase
MAKMHIKGVNPVKRKLADGTIKYYYYWRATGKKLPDDPESAEFLAAVAKCMERAKSDPFTMGRLIEDYMRSPEYSGLADSTKASYKSHLDAIKALSGDLPNDEWTEADVYQMRDDLWQTAPRQAELRVAILSRLFNWGAKRGYRKDNPAADIEKIKRKTKSYEPWSEEEITAFYKAAPKHVSNVVTMALYTGQRQGDCLKMTWGDISDGAIQVRQEKTDRTMWIPIHADLQAMLDGLKKRPGRILLTSRDKPWTNDGFRSSFATAKEGIDKQFHGLRATAATNLADAGVPDKEIMAITGHRTTAMVTHYTRNADQKRRATAAVAKLPSRKER